MQPKKKTTENAAVSWALRRKKKREKRAGKMPRKAFRITPAAGSR